MNIKQFAAKLYRTARNDPLYVFSLFLVVIIYFPKYLYYLIKADKIIGFDWRDGTYKDFYWPLYERLSSCGLKIVFLFDLRNANEYGITVFRKGLPWVYANFLDNKVVICAAPTFYDKLCKTVRIQIFHGFGSFGSGFGRVFIDRFDVLFLTTAYQMQQLNFEYKEAAADKKIFPIGYPKIDKLVSKINSSEYKESGTSLFYGPTYHREISSIFDFLPTIVEVCKKNNYRLIVKLHPFLCRKNDHEASGGIDWLGKIEEYERYYDNIVIVRGHEKLADYFRTADIFLTDVSGIGFEFVLSTGKPIIFLGTKLKVPLEDLRQGNTNKYRDCPEIYYRGKIGPVVIEPMKLETTIKQVIEKDGYKTERQRCRREFTFNLGSATDAAVSQIRKIYEEL